MTSSRTTESYSVSGGRFEMRNLQSLLLRLLSDHFVGAYLIHAEPPYVTAPEARPDTIHRYWYRITGSQTEVSVRSLNPKIPPELEAVINAALEKDR